MSTKVSKIVSLPFPQAFDRLYHTIANAGYAISLADSQRGLIKFNSQASATDWGFDFTAQVFSANPYSSQIQFSGDVKFGIDLFKVGNKKIEKLMTKF